MTRTIVGVLRGGASAGYGSSLRSGAAIIRALPPEAYDVRDILIDQDSVWHTRGMAHEPMRALQGLDIVINALYNDALAEGGIARALKQSGVPYTGTRGATASLLPNRSWMRQALQGSGIRMARAKSLGRASGADVVKVAQDIFAGFGPPYVLKPVAAGHSVGARFVPTVHELPQALDDLFAHYEALIVEEYLPGTQVSVGVVEDFRNEPLYTLPPAQFILPEGVLLADFSLRESGVVRHAYPWIADTDHKQALADIARTVHQKLGLSHYSRADFVVRGPHLYLVSVNALPELHEESAFQTMLGAVGSSLPDFLDHVIPLARRR